MLDEEFTSSREVLIALFECDRSRRRQTLSLLIDRLLAARQLVKGNECDGPALDVYDRRIGRQGGRARSWDQCPPGPAGPRLPVHQWTPPWCEHVPLLFWEKLQLPSAHTAVAPAAVAAA
jgi:hypothetical protein